MADLSINMLPVSDGLTDDGLLVVYQNQKAQSIRGNLIKAFAKDGVEIYVESAREAARQAEQGAQQAESAVLNAPKIVGATWWVYDKAAGKYVDTGVQAQGPKGADGTMNFSDLTEEQKESLRGEPGPVGPVGPGYVLTEADKDEIAVKARSTMTTETWTFILEDGSTVTKAVYVG